MIIDFHTHIFPDKIAESTVRAIEEGAKTPRHSDGTAAGLIASMERAGVTLAVNHPVLTRARQFDHITAFAEEVNAREYPGARILSFGGVHPADPEAPDHVDELADRGFLGLKIHPDYQNTFFDDEAYIRILTRAKARGLITLTHAGVDAAYVRGEVHCTPERVVRVLDALGGYDRLVLAHIGGEQMSSEVLALLAGKEIYLDTAYSLHEMSAERFCEIVERHGDERILFATDSPWRDPAEELEKLRRMDLPAAALDNILYRNAAKLLGLVTI
ncbi:MAG: amidohydrolase family protein [Clostridia bacterium]|nr:amidohydrolase family protein [Clostridia bacterium]